jgi:hypothetical protein
MRYLCSLLYFFSCFFSLHAQSPNDSLMAGAIRADSVFWHAYNDCDISGMMQFVPINLEFYHDKGGITLGDSAFEASIKNGLCSDQRKYRLRREEVPGTNHAYPMMKEGKLYGVLMTGKHLFYISSNGEKEYADGLAQYADLWLYENDKWQVSRVFSYDHGPAPYANARKPIAVRKLVLQSYTGTYKGPSATLTLTVHQDTLWVPLGSGTSQLFAENTDLFFIKERDLTFEFVRVNKAVRKMIVREKGKIVEELEKIK